MIKKNILAICGSTQQNSSNKNILNHISKKYQQDFTLEIFESIDQLPHFNPDFTTDKLPAEVKAFQTKIETADALIICTPEYVFSLPGSLKNAIEWNVATTLFAKKPTALIVASSSGEKAKEALELIMGTLEAQILASILIKGAKGKMSKNGEITDEQTSVEIDHLILNLKQAL